MFNYIKKIIEARRLKKENKYKAKIKKHNERIDKQKELIKSDTSKSTTDKMWSLRILDNMKLETGIINNINKRETIKVIGIKRPSIRVEMED